MATKQINGRVILKHDTEENWLKAENFTPQSGEVVIYDTDENYDYSRIKIGNGYDNINGLPFLIEEMYDEDINDMITGASNPT